MRQRRPWSTARVLLAAFIAQAIALCITPGALAVDDVEAQLFGARQNVQQTIVQLDETIAQLDEARVQLENADALLDQCSQCADAAEAELARAVGKLDETIQQLVDTRGQLRVALDQVNEAIGIIQSGGTAADILPNLDAAIGLLQRSLDKVDRAIQKVTEVQDQINNALAFLADCGACVDAAEAEINRAAGLIDRALAKLQRSIDKITVAIDQLESVVDRELCPSDTDGNGVIDIDDIVNVVLDFDCGQPGHPVQPPCPFNGDVDNSGVVDIDDIVQVVIDFDQLCPGFQPEPVEVFGFFPPNGQTGDIIQIFGRGFDPDPDNNCAIVMMGPAQNCSLPLRVLDVQPAGPPGLPQDQVMLAQVGPIWEGATPGPIVVGRGTGNVGFFTPNPAFPNIQVTQPAWVWDRDPPGGPMGDTGPDLWNPDIPPAPNPWLHGEPSEGVLCLFLPPNLPWEPDQKVNISLRAHNHDTGIGHDADIPCIVLEGPNQDAFQCAEALCDAIQCAFFQLSGITINCFVEQIAGGPIKITVILKGPNGRPLPIDWGNFDVCLVPGTLPAPPVVIDNFFPQQGGTGTIVTIQGSGFDPDPDNNCAVVMVGGACSLPLQVIDVTPLPAPPGIIGGPTQEMRVRVGPVFPQAQPGPIMVATGQGAFDFFQPIFPEIQVTQPVWVWDRDPPNGPMDDTMDMPPFTPTQPIDPVWFHGEPENGELCLILPPDLQWCPDQKLDLTVRAHDHTLGVGKDGFFPCIIFDGPNDDPNLCIERLCDVIRCAFLQSGIQTECIVTVQADGSIKIQIKFFDAATGAELFVDWGNFDLCLYPCDPAPCQWDINNDGWVDQTDYQICIQLLGTNCANLPAWIDCPDFNGDGIVDINDCIKIELLIADGPVPCDPPDPDPVVIDNFTPTTGGTGTIVTIQGSGFDPDPDNNCAVVMVGGACSLPLQVIDVTPLPAPPGIIGGPTQEMRVRVGPIPPLAVPGPIMVATGNGAFDLFKPQAAGVVVTQPVWVWDRDPPNGPMGDTGGNTFDPTQPIEPVWFHGEPENGQLCLVLPNDLAWCPDQKLDLTIRGHDHTLGLGKDGFFPCIVFEGPNGDPLACAAQLCDVVRCAFIQSGLMIECIITEDPAAGTIKIQVLLFDNVTGAQLNIDWGNFDLCLYPCDTPPCPWDINNDGWVDQTDYQICLSFLGANCANVPAWIDCPDFNGDGVVDQSDCNKIEMLIGQGPFPCDQPN